MWHLEPGSSPWGPVLTTPVLQDLVLFTSSSAPLPRALSTQTEPQHREALGQHRGFMVFY